MATVAKQKTVKMSITKALAEVKHINEKIRSYLNYHVVAVEKGYTNQLINQGGTAGEFLARTKGALTSLNDLIERRERIKLAIAKANVETLVTIGNKKMPIIQVIDLKSVLEEKKRIVSGWFLDFIEADKLIEKQEEIIQRTTQQAIQSAFGSNQQSNSKQVAEIEKAQRFLYEGKICSNFKRDELDKIINTIEEQLSTIDMTLSEINSRTDISVLM